MRRQLIQSVLWVALIGVSAGITGFPNAVFAQTCPSTYESYSFSMGYYDNLQGLICYYNERSVVTKISNTAGLKKNLNLPWYCETNGSNSNVVCYCNDTANNCAI